MSTLSELLPAGGGGSTVDFVASGTLPNGKPVILKANGQVEVVGEASVSESIPAGSEAVFNTQRADHTFIAFDPNTAGKFIVVYRDEGNSNHGTAIAGTVSGTTLSFGSEVVFNSGVVEYTQIAFDPNTAGKFVITYMDENNSNYGEAIVGTLSGTTLSFGTAVVFNSAYSLDIKIAFDPSTAGKFVVVCRDNANSNYGEAIAGAVSGTSISFGSMVVFNTGSTNHISVAFDPSTAGKFVVAYRNMGNSNYGTGIVGTLSGTSISFTNPSVFNAGNSRWTSIAFDPNTASKFVVAYADNGNSGYGTAVVGTVAATNISFGSEVVFNTGSTQYNSIFFNPNTANQFVVVYDDISNSYYGTVKVSTISGTSISFGSGNVFNTGSTQYISVSLDPNTDGKFVVAYKDVGNSNYGTAIVGQLSASLTNLTSTNFVGTSTKAYTNGQTATIAVQGGLSTNQTGLTIGSTYFVQPAGTLATTAGTPSVNAGKALSTTTLLLKDL